MRRPNPELSICDFKEVLTEAGLQVSAPRLAIASYVLNTDEHPTAEEVKTRVEKFFPMVSLATVYNTLNLFVEKNLLCSMRDEKGDQLRYDCNIEPHFHFIDEESGRIMDLPLSSLSIERNSEILGKEFQISSMDIVLKGRLQADPSHQRIKTKNKSPKREKKG